MTTRLTIKTSINSRCRTASSCFHSSWRTTPFPPYFTFSWPSSISLKFSLSLDSISNRVQYPGDCYADCNMLLNFVSFDSFWYRFWWNKCFFFFGVLILLYCKGEFAFLSYWMITHFLVTACKLSNGSIKPICVHSLIAYKCHFYGLFEYFICFWRILTWPFCCIIIWVVNNVFLAESTSLKNALYSAFILVLLWKWYQVIVRFVRG